MRGTIEHMQHIGMRVPNVEQAVSLFEAAGYKASYRHGPYYHGSGRWHADMAEISEDDSSSRHHVGHLTGTRLRLAHVDRPGSPNFELLQIDAPTEGSGFTSLFKREHMNHMHLVWYAADPAGLARLLEGAGAQPSTAALTGWEDADTFSLTAPWGLELRLRRAPASRGAGTTEVTATRLGLRVPGLDQASSFLLDGLGFSGAERLDPVSLPDGGKLQVEVVRCGDTDLELFEVVTAPPDETVEFQPEAARTVAHPAWYVEDMEAAAAMLGELGISVDGLVGTGFGPEAGDESTYVHFLAWEQDMEFVSYPRGRAHQREPDRWA